MAVAPVTTFYGAVLDNAVLLSLASKPERNSQEKALINNLFVIGAASIGNQMMKVQFIDYAGDFLYEVIPTPSHLLGHISPIFTPFFPVFCAFSPSRRGGSNEPQDGTQGQETAGKGTKKGELPPSFDTAGVGGRITWVRLQHAPLSVATSRTSWSPARSSSSRNKTVNSVVNWRSFHMPTKSKSRPCSALAPSSQLTR